jgi:hypothetical protein
VIDLETKFKVIKMITKVENCDVPFHCSYQLEEQEQNDGSC